MNVWKTMLKVDGFIFATFIALPVTLALLMWWADGSERAALDTAHVFSIRYVLMTALFMLFLIPGFWVAKNRRPGTPLTWGEAMVAALYVFFLIVWIYGVIPHEFLTWADAELSWRNDQKIIGPEGAWAQWWSFWEKIPLTVNKESVRDVVAVLLYVIGLGGMIWVWAAWNNRAKAAEQAALPKSSTYGRPLLAEARRN